MAQPKSNQKQKQLKIDGIFKAVPSTATSVNGAQVTMVANSSRGPPTHSEGPLAKKSKQLAPNMDPYHESHQYAIVGLHYKKGVGVYHCTGPALDKPELNGKCNFTGDRVKVKDHAGRCWPNVRANSNMRDKRKYGQNSEQRRINKQIYDAKNRENLVLARESGESPKIPCKECNFFAHTQHELTIHTSNHHRSHSHISLETFLQRPEWRGPCIFEESNENLSELKINLDNFLENRQKTQNYAYLTIFLPNTIDTVEKVWHYLEQHATDSGCIIPYYPGKGSSHNREFNVESFHSLRPKSTIFEYIKENQMRAYQLIAIPMGSDNDAACQEAIFQKIGVLSGTRDPRPDTINYTIINQRADLTSWEKLSTKISDKAFNLGMQREPLLCLDKQCPSSSHQVPDEFCFGKLHRSEVILVPFDYERYLS